MFTFFWWSSSLMVMESLRVAISSFNEWISLWNECSSGSTLSPLNCLLICCKFKSCWKIWAYCFTWPLIFKTVFFSVGIFYLTNTINFKIILVGLLISIMCQIGDLFFSFLKRKSKVKDTGNFFPGHGGVLDRLDWILFGLPFGFIFLILLL